MKLLFHFFLILAVALITGCASTLQENTTALHESWAQPCQISGVPNCYVVEPGLYRSAQPTRQGIENLEKMGIANILSLRTTATDNLLASLTMMACHSVPMSYLKIDEKEVLDAVKIMNTPRYRPLLVHCLHGSDRTGVVCATYRVLVQGWAKEEAIAEMLEGDFGFHSCFPNIVEFIHNLDVEQARRKLNE